MASIKELTCVILLCVSVLNTSLSLGPAVTRMLPTTVLTQLLSLKTSFELLTASGQ